VVRRLYPVDGLSAVVPPADYYVGCGFATFSGNCPAGSQRRPAGIRADYQLPWADLLRFWWWTFYLIRNSARLIWSIYTMLQGPIMLGVTMRADSTVGLGGKW